MNNHPVNSSSNDQKVRFQLDRSLSSSSNIDIDSNVKNLDKLSPKLKTFFSFEDNNPKFRGIQNIDERFPVGYSSGGRAGKNKFLPSQLLNGGGDESLTSDGGSSVSSILHNIFSPKFHAQSAKKKKMMMNTESNEGSRQQTHQNTPHYHKQQQQHSIFSPISATSTPGRGQQNHDANNASIISEMSDEFSTIHAILRGNALKDYRKSVGWEAASHPIHWSDSDDVELDNSPAIDKEYPRVPYGKVELESKVENVDIISNDNVQYIHQQVESDGDNDIDDSTEVMLNMAIRMTSPENVIDHANTTKTPGKRPFPIHNDEFHTPSSSMKPRKSSPVMAIPLAVKSDLDSRILGGTLPPVWDEVKGHYNSDVRQLDASSTSSSIDVKDFRTPKQHGIVDHYDESDSDNNDDDDEEEFFSPLAAHTASLKKHDTSNLNSNTINTLVSTLTAIDFNNYAITVPSKRMTLSLPKKSAQLPTTNKDSGLTSSEATTTQFTVFHDDHPQDASHKCTSSHLHSPRVSTLSPDALTIDYIKSCTCNETLNTIHSLLTDVNSVTIHRNNHGKRGKQLRYPSLVRLVERQIQRLLQEKLSEVQYQKQQQTTLAEPLTVQLLPRVAREKVLGPPLEDNDGGSDKENVNPRQPFIHDNGHPTTITANEPTRASPIPMQCISVLHESSADRHGSPGSISMSRSSLDMNLSGSMMFALDDESHYWRQGGMADYANLNSNQNQGDVELTVHSIEEKAMTAEHFDKQSQTFDQDCIIKSYMELEDKLAMTLSANVILTSEVDSLVNEQQEIKAELSDKLGHMTKQLSRQQDIAASESTTQQAQIAELDRMNHSLREEIERLYRQLHLVNHNAESTALQLQFEIEDAKNKWSNHSTDKESLNKELIDIRSRYEMLLNEKKTATLESNNTQKLRLFAESAKLANAALANSLAVSEKDLAEANAAREKSERECDALRKHVVRLEDKASFLSAKLKEMNAELQSGHAYIDKLYADLQEIESSSIDLKCDFERRELEWTELEWRYSQRISELENKYGTESKNKVSLEAYMTVVKQTRHYKAEATKNQQTIDSLKERLAAGKATRALQVIGVSMPIHCNSQIEQQGGVVSKSDTQQGKHLNRVSVIRAAGGRKGLTEQLKRARGISPKANNTPSFTL